MRSSEKKFHSMLCFLKSIFMTSLLCVTKLITRLKVLYQHKYLMIHRERQYICQRTYDVRDESTQKEIELERKI